LIHDARNIEHKKVKVKAKVYTHLGSFLLDPEDIRELGIGAIWSFGKGTGLL
jgi:hypothetical protein